MKTITMTELRSEPGARLEDIKRNGDSFLITKSGRPAAILGPVDDTIEILPNGTIRGERPLTMGLDLGGSY